MVSALSFNTRAGVLIKKLNFFASAICIIFPYFWRTALAFSNHVFPACYFIKFHAKIKLQKFKKDSTGEYVTVFEQAEKTRFLF